MIHSITRKHLCHLVVASVIPVALTSCSDYDLFSGSQTPTAGEPVDVTISLNASNLNSISGSTTRSAASSSTEDIVCEMGTPVTTRGINDPKDVIKTTIKNLWILQYDGIEDDAKLVTSAYIEKYGDGEGQTQTAKLIASTANNMIIFIANTFDPNLPFQVNSTIKDLKDRKFTTQSLGTIVTKDPSTKGTGTETFPNDGDYYQRLNGSTTTTVSEGSTISGTLAHNACRVSVNVTNKTAGKTYPVTLQYADIEKVPGCMYFYTDYTGYTSGTSIGKPSTSVTNLYGSYNYSNVITWSSEEGTSATTKSAKLYLSPNESGVITTNNSPKLKSLFAPSRSTILRIHGTYKDGSNDIPITYSFALGEDMTQNYQLVPNGDYVYNITLNARGDKTTDGRVSYGSAGGVDYTDLTTWPLSNCYICNPPSSGSATFKIPVARVDQFWGNNNYEYVPNNCLWTTEGSRDWTVSVIWSDMVIDDTNFKFTKFTGNGKDDYFEVSIPSTCVKGNVIVGIKNANTKEGEYLWSWHLWVTDYCPDDAKYLTQQGAFLTGTDTYHITGGDVQRYSVAASGSVQKVYMDRCIGAMDKDATGYPRGTMYYQFGRKDPFPGNSEEYYAGGTAKATYSLVTKAYNATDETTQPKNVPYSVYNPTTFITSSSSYWTYGDIYNPESGNSDIYWQDPWISKNGGKSIFDPSPSGWKVPTTYSPLSKNAYSGGVLTANTGVSGTSGSVTLPALGCRIYSNGSLSNGGTYGFYWSSSPSGTTYAFGLHFYSGNFNAHNGNNGYNPQRVTGKPVRPVQE